MLSPELLTFISDKGRPRQISRIEAYARKHGNTDVHNVSLVASEPCRLPACFWVV